MSKNTLSSITLAITVILFLGGLVNINRPDFEPDLWKAILEFCIFIPFGIITWLLRRSVAREEKDRQERADAEKQQREQEAQEKVRQEAAARRARIEAEPRIWRFYLDSPDDLETQKQLHDLRIRLEAYGLKGDLNAAPEEIGYAFRFDGFLLGTMQPGDAHWLSDHEDDLMTWTGFEMFGGDTDKTGCLRPVTTRITAELRPGEGRPPVCGPLPLLPSAVSNGRIKGDKVVWVSSTKKIHLGMALNCPVKLDKCTPMLYAEALQDGCTECGHCFQ